VADWADKITKLLAQAESTPHVAERNSAIELAQELMTKHAIDEGMLQAKGKQPVEKIVEQGIRINRPDEKAKLSLLNSVANANDCRTAYLGSGHYIGWSTGYVFGFESDVRRVKMMYTSLLLQMTNEMLATVPPRGVHILRFRNNFIRGYSMRIYRRLMDSRHKVIKQAPKEAALVLVNRGQRVKEWVEETLDLRRGEKDVFQGDYQSQVQGAKAANRADISSDRLGTDSRGKLPG